MGVHTTGPTIKRRSRRSMVAFTRTSFGSPGCSLMMAMTMAWVMPMAVAKVAATGTAASSLR
jgi:hypothetical protein